MRLIIASNRSPYTLRKRKAGIKVEKSAGGLVSALDPIVKKTNGIWVCSGDNKFSEYNVQLPYDIRQIKLTPNEMHHYYEGFCNTQIWPLFHYFPGRYKIQNKDWEFYKQVNQKFANQILDIVEPDDKIWIQDYHLMYLPKILRDKGVENQIGFFLHIPFPNIEVFRIFPRRNEIMEGLLSCNLVGFHTESYKKHFIECVNTLDDAEVDVKGDTICFKNNECNVGVFPISIDYKLIESIANAKSVQKKADELRKNINSQIIGIGVDRLDYTKGILERLAGYEYFLENNPEYHKKITLIQLAVPTRTGIQEYINMKKEVDETIGRINGKFSKEGWNPICYIYNSVSLKDLVAYYMASDFIIVSALRDGLNLVAKEYVASRINNDGTLILSEFTGAAEELCPKKNTINPYDEISISKTILRVINMSEEDKSVLMKQLRTYIKTNDIYKWVDDFLCKL